MNILENLKAPTASEKKVGSSEDAPDVTQFSEETKESNEIYRFYVDTLHFDEKEALASTKTYYAKFSERLK
jgi:hypothetical protein